MLVLTRKVSETLVIDDNIFIHITQVKGQQVRVGIDAPSNVKIMRAELLNKSNPKQDKKTPIKIIRKRTHSQETATHPRASESPRTTPPLPRR